MLGTGEGGGKCCGKAKDEVNPRIQGKTTSLKYMVFVVIVILHQSECLYLSIKLYFVSLELKNDFQVGIKPVEMDI